jgi:hypothetical protein
MICLLFQRNLILKRLSRKLYLKLWMNFVFMIRSLKAKQIRKLILFSSKSLSNQDWFYTGRYGDYLTSGVTISALLPMRPIPFKIVYVLGMQEGDFPGRADTSSLDLRLGSKKTWGYQFSRAKLLPFSGITSFSSGKTLYQLCIKRPSKGSDFATLLCGQSASKVY